MLLSGKRIAVLAEDLYEDLELWYPYFRLIEAGAEVVILGTGKERFESKRGLPVKPDGRVEDVTAGEFDGVVIPGGYAPDKMRRHPQLVAFVRALHERGALVGFICHAGWVPASADILRGRRVTSAVSIRDDLVNAGGEWVDEAVVRDGNLVSSRNPHDLPAFCRAIIEHLSER